MKIIFTLLLCALFCVSNLAQTVKPGEVVGITEITLARAVGADGNLSESRTVFAANDVPIYCSLQLASVKSVAVKMNVVAVAAVGLKPDSIVVSVAYKTDGTQDGVNFTASPRAKLWTPGRYRVDILLDGKTAKSLEFTIEKSANQTERQIQSPPKQKPKRKSRKN